MALETRSAQVKFVDEDIDHANRVVRTDIVVQTPGRQCNLASVFAFDESLHRPTSAQARM